MNLRLPGRNYQVVHADTVDERGIDVAFLHDPGFVVPPGERFNHVVMRRTATREILQVNFQTPKGRTWSVCRALLPRGNRHIGRVVGVRLVGDTVQITQTAACSDPPCPS